MKNEADLGHFVGEIVALLPEVSDDLIACPLKFHCTVSDRFPGDFRNLRARSAADKCVILAFSDVPADHQFLVVCLLGMSFSIVQSAGH